MTTAHAQRAPEVVEDVFDGRSTGVEVEREDEAVSEADSAIARPWDPAQIRVAPTRSLCGTYWT